MFHSPRWHTEEWKRKLLCASAVELACISMVHLCCNCILQLSLVVIKQTLQIPMQELDLAPNLQVIFVLWNESYWKLCLKYRGG